ncbi:MAG: sulfate ABC transporter permease subunit CysW [Verrucomicrobium sp.]|nr:sulfate ABC transporter permease subunit CysW [Verrucomicrobium sp.]
MSGLVALPAAAPRARRATADAPPVRALLLAVTAAFLLLFLVVPLGEVFAEAFAQGPGVAWAALRDPDCRAAIGLTLLTAAIAVPLNTAFGIAAAWALTRYRFPGRRVLSVLIDLPLWVSPVIGGLVYVLLFGRHGFLWPWLDAHGIRIVFALPGIVLGTTFVTVPFVARSLIPLMESQGVTEEEAAYSLGAGGWQILRRITLPKVKWALLYGVILCNARAMGEFGAVSVLSGHIRGLTNTLPLHIEVLYNDYQYAAAFAAASLLCLLALVTLALKTAVEWGARRQEEAARAPESPS